MPSSEKQENSIKYPWRDALKRFHFFFNPSIFTTSCVFGGADRKRSKERPDVGYSPPFFFPPISESSEAQEKKKEKRPLHLKLYREREHKAQIIV